MENQLAFMKFKNSISSKHQLSNGDIEFDANVTYQWKRQTLSETLKVKFVLAGYEQGSISLYEGDEINSDVVHMDFKSNFGTYSFTNEHYLVIENTSSRLGKYKVTIVAL